MIVTIDNALKMIFLLIAIVYTFSNAIKAKRGHPIKGFNIVLMAIGIVGFIAMLLGWISFS